MYQLYIYLQQKKKIEINFMIDKKYINVLTEQLIFNYIIFIYL